MLFTLQSEGADDFPMNASGSDLFEIIQKGLRGQDAGIYHCARVLLEESPLHQRFNNVCNQADGQLTSRMNQD